MKTLPVFILTILVIAWASWLFRYDFQITSSGEVASFDRWTGRTTLKELKFLDNGNPITEVTIFNSDGSANYDKIHADWGLRR